MSRCLSRIFFSVGGVHRFVPFPFVVFPSWLSCFKLVAMFVCCRTIGLIDSGSRRNLVANIVGSWFCLVFNKQFAKNNFGRSSRACTLSYSVKWRRFPTNWISYEYTERQRRESSNSTSERKNTHCQRDVHRSLCMEQVTKTTTTDCATDRQ